MQFLVVGGRRLECAWHGSTQAGAPAIVLLHEGLGCVSMWKSFPQRLHDATGLAVFAYSRAGYGASDAAEVPRAANYMHDEALLVLPKLLERAGIRDVILLGHSDGASIAIVYAGSAQAQGLRGLVLMAPHVFNEPICSKSVTAAGQRYRHGELRQALARHHGAQVDHTFWGWHDVWLSDAFGDWNIEARLSRVAAPVVLIQGADDEYGTLRQLDAIEAGVRVRYRRVILEACGHSPHRDQPELTLEAITTFTARDLRSA